MNPIKHKYYKYCIVPMCKNTTVTAPEKLFFCLPKNDQMRSKWCIAMKRDENLKLSSITPLYCCEDHFSLEEDMENYWQHKLIGNVQRLQLKKGVIPHNFKWGKKTVSEQQTDIEQSCQRISQQTKCEVPVTNLKTLHTDWKKTLPEQQISTKRRCLEIIHQEQRDVATSSKNIQISSKIVASTQDKSIQVQIRSHCESKGVNVKPEQISVCVSSSKIHKTDAATSPMKTPLNYKLEVPSGEGSMSHK